MLPDTHVRRRSHDADRRRHVARHRRRHEHRLHRPRARRRRRHRARHDRERAARTPSFDGTGLPTLPLMGKNLIAHLRSNLVIRVPRAAIPGLAADDQRAADVGAVRKGRGDEARTATCSATFTCRSRRPAAATRSAPRTSCSGRSPTSTSSTSCARPPIRMSPSRSAASARWRRPIPTNPRRASEPCGPRPADRRVRRAARGRDADAHASATTICGPSWTRR